MPVLPNFLIFSVTPRFTCTAWAVVLLRHFAVLARWPSGEANCQTTATFAVVYWYDLGAVSALKPDVSILEIGTNDLVANRPEVVGSEIDDVVQLLQQSNSVRVIGVCEAIPRVRALFFTMSRSLYFNWGPCCSCMS